MSRDNAFAGGNGVRGSGQPAADDLVLPFRTLASNVTGRVVRLSSSLDEILERHEYPVVVAAVLGEALALVSLIGAGLKFDGRLSLQTRTDGPLGFLVADYTTPGHLRGYAGFDRERLIGFADTVSSVQQGRLLGNGHLAFTIDPGGDMNRYQGIVALDGQSLTAAAHAYFRQSEQLPTFIRLAVAREPGARSTGSPVWRAGGLIIQNLALEGGRPLPEVEGEALPLAGDGDDNWVRARLLAATVEADELVDPDLSAETLLVRLFHEEGVEVQAAKPIAGRCTCSRERVAGFLERFAGEQLNDLREPDGAVVVTCEFCSTSYRFEPGETP
ncbi:MAG: Hsp33 family molecular chaperone [Hyphomicrobiaceae bacterium]|nr:Hsp33 family molecular chaperone [Hyphomicrobiaceae bacterium]